MLRLFIRVISYSIGDGRSEQAERARKGRNREGHCAQARSGVFVTSWVLMKQLCRLHLLLDNKVGFAIPYPLTLVKGESSLPVLSI